MNTIVPLDICTGCGVCYTVCNKNAISMIHDKKGFLFPHIDMDKCVGCNLCKFSCPALKAPLYKNEEQEAFCAYNNNSKTLKESTSGGIFTALAKYVINKNGVVCGVTIDNKNASHIIVDSIKDLEDLRGSKYIQSKLTLHKEIERLLKDDKLVLFSGTPCQVDGLQHFLKKEYDNLITCEVVCYGVGSQRVFDDYVDYLNPQKLKIDKIYFRKKTGKYKPSSFVIRFENGKQIDMPSYYNYFGYLFSKQLISRPSCYTCRYSNKKRVADFSLGDYSEQDLISYSKEIIKNGLSLLVVNSKKGMDILLKIDDIILDKKDYGEIKSSAFMERNISPKLFDDFFTEYDKIGNQSSIKKYNKIIKKELVTIKKNKIKNIIKKILIR